MTDIEQKALALVNEVLAEWGVLKNAVEVPKNSDAFARALLRAIEQHEDFRQEVSDALREWGVVEDGMKLSRFIIPKPDPLVEVINDADDMVRKPDAPSYAEAIRAAIKARGGRIVWEGE